MSEAAAKVEDKKAAPSQPVINHMEAFQLAVQTAQDSNLARSYLELRRLVFTGRAVVSDFMPNIGKCAIQDYGRLNQFMLETDRLWACTDRLLASSAAPAPAKG